MGHFEIFLEDISYFQGEGEENQLIEYSIKEVHLYERSNYVNFISSKWITNI